MLETMQAKVWLEALSVTNIINVITVVVFPPFPIPAGSGKLYLNSRGNVGKMQENFKPYFHTKIRKFLALNWVQNVKKQNFL